jgi:hypothetical protein
MSKNRPWKFGKRTVMIGAGVFSFPDVYNKLAGRIVGQAEWHIFPYVSSLDAYKCHW